MKILFNLIAILISLNIYSQVITNDAMIFNDLPETISQLKRTSLSIEVSDKNLKNISAVGSGFLILKKDLNYAVTNYAVTNYHVINNIPKDQIILIGMNLEMRKQYAFVEQIYTDEQHDIAVMRISNVFTITNKNRVDSNLFKPSSVGMSVFEKTDKILEGTGIILIGYPLGIGSEYTGNQPISRIGIVAQEPNLITNTFFIDGIASHGNSGSPVFNAQSNMLMGMIVSFPSDFITAFDENGQLIAKFPYNSGISLCVTAEIISKLIP